MIALSSPPVKAIPTLRAPLSPPPLGGVGLGGATSLDEVGLGAGFFEVVGEGLGAGVVERGLHRLEELPRFFAAKTW